MTCMTTKKKFDVTDPVVVVLKNNRFAYRTPCPWRGKNGKELVAFKFCSRRAYEEFEARTPAPPPSAQTAERAAETPSTD